MTSQLEFEVLHRNTRDLGSEEEIGVAFVDISSLYHLNSAEASRMISGYYHLVDRQTISSNIQLSQVNSTDINKLSRGQLKITLTIDKTLTHLRDSSHNNVTTAFEETKQAGQTFGGKKSLVFGAEDED